MRYGLLLGMAIALLSSLPVMGSPAGAGQDSMIIADVTVEPGQSSVSVPVYFVTHGDVTYYNLPLMIQGADNVKFCGYEAAAAVESWDDSWQGISSNGSQSLQMGFADLGGEDNLGANTNGERVIAFQLLLAVDGTADLEQASILPRIDSRAGGPLFGIGDGLQSSVPVVVGGMITLGSGDAPQVTPLPTSVSLSQNFPNPFNPSTEISFALPDLREVNLSVYDVLGQEIKSLVSGPMAAGFHRVIWNGANNDGAAVPSGTYFYRLDAGDYSQSMKMVMLK